MVNRVAFPPMFFLTSSLCLMISNKKNKPPSKYAVKQAIIKWQEENKIPFFVDRKKDQLFALPVKKIIFTD